MRFPPAQDPARAPRRMRALLAAATTCALVALPAATLGGCGATTGGGHSLVRVEAPEWVNDPAAGWDAALQPCVFFATGRAPPDRQTAVAQRAARDQALATVSAFVDAAITRFDASFASRAAGVVEPAAMAALRSDPGLRHQLDDAARAAVSVQGQWADDDKFCVWVRFDAAAGLLAGYEQALSRKLAAQARELTPADHESLRADLAACVAERNGAR